MTASSSLYEKITIKNANTSQVIPGTKTYKGFSTASGLGTFSIYDIQCIKQDLLNHFHVRLGERLEQPEFGTIIWDVLFEPLTEELRTLIIKNVEAIVNYDPRIRADQIIVSTYEHGIQIECVLVYYPYNIQEAMQLRFDRDNGLLLAQ